MAEPYHIDKELIEAIDEIVDFEPHRKRAEELVPHFIFLGCVPVSRLVEGDELDIGLAYRRELGAPRDRIRVLHGIVEDPMQSLLRIDRDSFQDGTFRSCRINLASCLPIGVREGILAPGQRAVVDPSGSGFMNLASVEYLPAAYEAVAVNDVRIFP